jgi:murein DD-endopeptidase MepM/ murein hydrolase activator NlpD
MNWTGTGPGHLARHVWTTRLGRLGRLNLALAILLCSASDHTATAYSASDHTASAYSASDHTGAGYTAPLPEPLVVVHPFAAPMNPYASGKRGVDLVARPGAPVRAAAAGVVRFAGQVAGRGVLVVDHGNGISTEYEPLAPSVTVGTPVTEGQVLGSVDAVQADCAPTGCLHWGARRGRTYFDPLLLLRPLGPVRLLPWT